MVLAFHLHHLPGSLHHCFCDRVTLAIAGLALVLLAFIVWSAIYYGVESVLTGYGVFMVVLALGFLARSTPKINQRD
jgi:hypothetical protein